MEIYIIIVGSLILVSFVGGFIWLAQKLGGNDQQKVNHSLMQEIARLEAELDHKNQTLGEQKQELKNTETERDHLFGVNKQLLIENERIKGQNDTLLKEKSELQKKIITHESQKNHAEKEQKDLITKLEEARMRLEKEQARVIREDEKKLQQEKEAQNRIWSEHENGVISQLRETCQKPYLGFRFYDNTALPSDFHSALKPDFLVEFLDQYIVFDAKKSLSNLSTYLNNQAKTTAQKYQKEGQIYSTIFFVVPTRDLEPLKKRVYFEAGYQFFVIGTEAIEPILACFKRITEYERIQDFDPQDRETLVQLIAHYDRHIAFQNATNILLAQESVQLMNQKESLPSDFQSDIATQKQNLRPVKLKEAALKKLSQNLEDQQQAIGKLVAPKAAISQKELEAAQQNLSQ